ncbi:uncharacterized protein B0H18DRAFT_1053142 [Fomitopsis serialis]|uniref:uncharacterized protein n=1 Tax=Fomitopsis serialis TaxID=139415 RepID=UPI002007A785|nr:uncharacterized protein B0H18DRAFT_1053142 [Neoantrodia serialis]KAH9912603.1 hypothetical protein B0H18DRAFT_1053142 [Neoantrodia serialis]
MFDSRGRPQNSPLACAIYKVLHPSFYPLPRCTLLPLILFPVSLPCHSPNHTSRLNKYVRWHGCSVHVEVELHSENSPDQETLHNGRNIGKTLPADYTRSIMHTVVIDGIDRSPCCGTHMPTIHDLFVVPHTELLATRASSTSVRLSCGMLQVPEHVVEGVEERNCRTKHAEDVEAELAG